MIARGAATCQYRVHGGLIASQAWRTTPRSTPVGLSETLAKDLRPHGIGVTVICPMGVATRIRQAARNRPATLRNAPGGSEPGEMTLIGRTLDADDVAAQTLAAIRTDALYVITHDEALDPLRRRFQRLEDAVRRRATVYTARATAILCHRV
jgi:NAD(P)-dependent dehydrogenase (short-subunit alcohol dehydrogenase family)